MPHHSPMIHTGRPDKRMEWSTESRGKEDLGSHVTEVLVQIKHRLKAILTPAITKGPVTWTVES